MRSGALVRGVVAIGVVALAFAAGRCSAERSPDGPGASARHDSGTAKPRTVRTSERAAPPTGAPDADDPRAREAGSGETSSAGPSAAADGVAIDVVVLDGGGGPAEYADVYALPAEERGTDDYEEIPYAQTDASGRARLFVVHAAKYDVGTVREGFAAMARDVEVPTADPVRLTLPPEATVTVRFDAPLSVDEDGGPGDQAQVSFDNACDGEKLWLPGRGETATWHREVFFRPAERTAFVSAPRGARIRPSDLPHDCVADPEETAGPATVVIRADARPRLRFHVRFEPEDFRPLRDVQVIAEFDAGPGSSPRPYRFCWDLPGGSPVGAETHPPLELHVPDAPGVLRWSGERVVAGEATFTASRPDAEEHPLEIVVRIDPDRLVRTPGTMRARLQWTHDPSRDASAPRISWHAWSADDSRCGNADWEDFGADVEFDGADWVAAVTEFSVSAPVRAPTADGATIDFVFHPGGCLVVLPDGAVPAQFGQLTLRRKDGMPFPTREADTEESEFGVWVPVRAGQVLGPFLPGDVTFEVHLGRTRIGEATGHVVAGRYITLAVPVRPRR